ncbi:MAG: DUF1467 family protein [Alphaproteobacteria bacterium]|nr:DUF1467 family protein [Alphaproteobacteria bacterium]
MQIFTNFMFIFFIIWWLVLLPLLSMGHEIEETPEEGHDSGAPKNPKIGKKFLLASLITFMITTLIMIFLHYFGIV